VIGVLARAAALTGVYLLVLTSVAPGDVAVGAALGLALAVALRPRHGTRAPGEMLGLIVAAADAVLRTAGEMVVGAWRVARFCLGSRSAAGFVEVPREDRTGHEVALWGLLTGEAPDEVVVDLDPARAVMIVHLVDAGDAAAVRERHRQNHARWRRRVAR
jgi:multisubunit Na+/H+ antiporter MnhE subunit